ncbi:MAG: strawberry notch C-terminal domain-containing protein [Segatella copri]
MAGDKFDQLYNALKADGAVSGTREHFRQFVYAPGKQGYHNRKQLYDALHADGAVSSSSYEEFAQRLGLHAVNPKPQQQKPVQPVKKLTMKQRAQEVAAQYRKPRQQKAQQPRTATTSGTDYMQNWRLAHMRNDQMNPMQQAQVSNSRARMQRAQEQSARQEQQRATPISRSRITPTAKNFNETMQQLSTPEAKQARAKQQREDDARAFAQYEVEGNKFVRNDGQSKGILGNDLLELVDSSMNEAQELTRQQYQQNLDKMGGIYAPQSVKEQAFRDAQTQEQVNRQNVLMNNLSSKINEIYSQKGMQRHIAESAEKLNMSVEEYVDKYVTPEIMNYAQKALTMRNQEEIMPHGALDYIVKNLSNSIIGMVVAPSVMSRDTRQRLQEGIAIADGDAEIQKVAGHKDETYRSGIGTRFASTAVNMAADSGPLAVIGAGASAAVNTGTRVLTNGLVKAGVMKAAQKLTAQQMAFKVANMTTAQKIMSGLGTRTATGALNLAGYSGVTAALNQASTGDDTSLQAIGEAGLKGAEHGAVTGAMFGVSGAIMSPWVSKFGITGMEKSTGERLLHGAQKFGATAAGLGVEAGTMMVADNVTGDKDISFGTWLEDVVMVGAFKAGEPSNFVKMGNILHHLTHNSGGNFVIGKNANGSPIAVDIRMTPDEKNELISSASGKNLMDAFVKVDRASKTAPRDPKYKTAYTDFMNDSDVSQSTKEKVNAAMGLFNTTRGKSYRSVNDVKNKQILEYTKNGTLLTRTSYKNADERRAILYKQKLYRDNDDMMSLIGYSKMKDMQLTDEDGNVTSLALGFLRNNGYDTSKDVTDPINAQLINDLRNPKSALYLDWEKYVDVYGSYGDLKVESADVVDGLIDTWKKMINDKGNITVDIDNIMRKDPMKRTDQENKIFYYVKSELENRLFPSWRPHADQSASQGKTVAEEHSLGTDNPDSGVVVDELRNLRNAEQALDAAMDSNDVFKQTFEKLHQQGLTPAQIYDALIQNGLTQEELTPLAQYINANARVQGMQQATADAIEENVKSFISDWSYHGTLNGQAMNGEQALYVQDSNGRTLLVGSGDVAFDQTTGRAKEGSGDMLVCLDSNTKEMVYVKADEVTLLQNQPIDQFAAEYRQRLQMKNSEPYNQAAQEQAMQDAAKAQQEVQPKENKNEEISNNETDGKIRKGDNANSGSDGEAEENASEGDASVQQVEQPQQTRKFADGTDVPMATDSKGRPTPDYASMTPEQSAEILTEDFGENAEKVVDGQIKKAENALKDAEKMKVDYTAEPNDIMEQEALKNQTIEAAKKQLEHAQNIKKTMTAKKVAETVGSTEQTEGAHEAGSVAAQKFVNAPRLVGNKRTRMLPDGETKIKGHYEIVPAESLTPSHDVNNDYKKSEGFPTDAEGRTVNDRDYEHDKAAQQNTDQIARKYNGMAIEQVPVVSDEGIVYDGNGRTMAGQKAAKEGTDAEYINDLLENAENFGFTKEQIEQSGIEHPRLVLVTDERLPYDAATFAKFNRNEKKTQSNTEQAVAKAKTLTSDEVGAIVAEIEGNGSLDAFFNNSKAINDLVKTLVDKGIIGQNEVAQMMDSPERLSAQGREYVKNLLLGSIFKPETIRMLGIDSTVKNKAINAIRSVMDNMKLGEFSLRDEIDQAIQLLYEARQGGNKVDTLLRTPSMFGEDAAKRYPSISQMMALALEGKVSDFRDLLDEYNRIAAARNTGEGSIFEAAPTKEELVKEFLDFKKWQDYGTGHSEIEGSNDVSSVEKPQQEASGGNEPAEAGTEPERPRVEEPDDLVNKELESRIKVTDEETETPSKNGPIMKQKILIDGDKEVIKVDEPNEKGEYTGSYYEYDGKKFGDLNEVVEYVDGKVKEKPLPLLPKEEKPDATFDPIAAAAQEFKKEHPLTEEEIMKADVDNVAKDMALDYLNGEVTDDLHRAIYESIFAKTREQKAEPKVETPKAEPSADPMEGIKNAAEGFEKEKKDKVETENKTQQTADDAAVAASNKKVNDLWDMLKNAGKDEISASFVGLNSRQLEVLPKLVSAMAENAYLRIKRGMHNLEDVVKEMRKEFAPAAKLFKKEDVDAIYEQMMNIRYRDGEQRMSLKEWADYYEKTSPKHQENLVGDSKTAEERKMAEKKFIDVVNLQLGFKHKFNGIVELRKIAERVGLKDIKDTDLQELAETAIVKRARGIASSESTNDAVKFERIKTLYENQPSLNQRDSERVMKQQYSTPAPYAFLADMYVKGKGKVIDSALEPSAGNGMLTIGLPMDKVHVNDIDAQRLANLRRQGFKNVTSQDGTQPFKVKPVDIVITNPPFGSATTRDYDGYKISSLEGQMAINALESMKGDGRAAIIIGGNTEYAKNGSLKPKDKAFLGYLYSHYNVEDVINVDGGLYTKQGTSYPTRIILINGRRLNENAFPPVKDKARAETVKDYDELYKRIEDDILRGERMDSSIGGETRSAQPELDKQGAAGTPKERVPAGERGGSKPNGKRESDLFDSTSVSGTHDDLENQRGTEPRQDGGLSDGDSRADGTGSEPSPSKEPTTGTNEQRGNGSGGAGRNDAQPSADESANAGSGSGPRGQLQRVDKSVRGLSTEKVTYTPKSGNPFTLKAVMPADQQEAVNKNLEKLGDADQFLVDELGYNDKDDLYSHLAAEQVDSVALALQQAKKGNAFIIGDMTGIGKGRQAASLIRYAKKQGQVPVYFTKTAGLLSDVYRDLVDIGNPDLRPFVFGSAKEAAITDSDGKVVFALPSKSEVKRVLDYIEKNGKLPDEYDYVLTTYSQVSNGVYEFDENGARKEKKLAKGKTFGAAAMSGQRRRDAIEKLMGNAYLILDESHTAGGNSGQGNYFQHIIQKAKNVTFFSATFAKRPDNMPIYALRTAMNEGGMKSSDLIDAVKRGGATLQEIMSQTLTQCGQMIRRERDMTGVTIDWKAIDDPERVQEQREQYDSIIGLFNDIINFQKKYVSSYVDERNDELAAIQSTIGIKKGTAALGIKNQPFASKAFNTVQQVLLSLKAKSAAERAIDYLKQGMKPVIALNNTNESQTGNLALGEEMDAPDLGTSLKKGLEGTLRYTQKDAKDNRESGYIKLSDLGDEAVEAYHELEKKIEQTSTGLSLSPIDVIKNELQKAGYKVGELTGRQTEFVYNDNGTVTKVKRADTDKKKLARDFNDGKIDALILNKSAATGISLHASSKYKDQKKRVMIVAQQQLDVNDEVQMRGRIDRTGQVARGAYEYVVSLIPAEQRLLMMFKAKLKSLDANTTSSQKSKFNEMEVADITNKYGDKVVREYMAEHLDLYARMADPFGWEKTHGDDLSRIDPQTLVASGGGVGDGEAGADASKLLGRMALLRVSEQEKMLQEIGELYANEIQRLNEMGENDLEITELPLKAKTLHKEVWKQGAEPGGDNAFADNTYIEKVNMVILKKPMKASEVKASQDGLTGGKTWDEYKTEKKAAVKEYFDQKIADETQKYEERAVKAATKAKEKYIKDGKKGQKDSGMSDEQIEKMAGYQYDNIYKQEKDKLNDVVKNLKAKAEMFERVLDTFDTNQTFVLPTDMNNPNELSGFGNSYGRLIDIKITDNYSPNASSVSFATLDGRRKITFPIAGKVGAGDNKADVISAIDNMTKQAIGMGDSHLRVLNQNFDNWDRLTSNESRKNGYIVTGNLMQALVDSKDQGLGGQLVKYTTDTGEVKTGILMPDRFDPKGLTTDAPINSVTEKFELSSWHGGIDEVTSSDGEVKVKRIDNNRGNFYELRVPKSKAKGGKYFMDEDLLKLVNGNNFETRGNNMLAEFKPEQLKPVLDRLSKMGVKVQEERNTSEDEGTHFREDRGLQYSKTDTKDVKNSRIIPEDVDKNVSSQIEKKFDDRVDELTKDLSDEDKAEFNRHLDYYTSVFSRYKASEITYTLNGLENDVRFWGRSLGNGEKASRTHLVRLKTAELRAAETAARREMDYREVRAKALADGYGLRRGAKASFADISRLFEATNQAKEEGARRLFEKAFDIAKRLGVEFGGMDEGDERGNVGEATPERNINLFIDTLSRTYTNPKEAAHTILHELIHQGYYGCHPPCKGRKGRRYAYS